MFLPVPVCFLCNDSLKLSDPTHAAKVRQLQVQTECSAHSLGAILRLQPSKPLFYLTLIYRYFLFVPSPYYCSHILPATHKSGGLAAGNDKR